MRYKTLRGIMNSKKGEFEIRDPLYGFIDFTDWEKQIIDHEAFQRLRRIRQLGLTDMVYPGATHTRFEHSLGVMHLATLMFDAIVKKPENMKILNEELRYDKSGLKIERQLIRLAALLHDIGHAPFSHASEELMPKNNKTGKQYTHENYTTAFIEGPLKSVIENNQRNKNCRITAKEVAALIEGNKDVLGERAFWKVIISSQLDADRSDYLLRDSYHIGVKYGIYDHARLLNTLALGIKSKSQVVLGINKDDLHIAESIIIARYRMFSQVYFHKTIRAFDYHLEKAMKRVLIDEKLPSPKELDEFMKLDDNVLWASFQKNNTDPNCKTILNRTDFIKKVYSTPETSTKEKEEATTNKEILDNNKIWCHLDDKAEKSWYKLDPNEEIMIIDEGKPYPLSERSYFIKNIKEIKQIKIIYTEPKDIEAAENVLKHSVPISQNNRS